MTPNLRYWPWASTLHVHTCYACTPTLTHMCVPTSTETHMPLTPDVRAGVGGVLPFHCWCKWTEEPRGRGVCLAFFLCLKSSGTSSLPACLPAWRTFYSVKHLVMLAMILKGLCYLSFCISIFSAFVLVLEISYKSNTYRNVAIWYYLFLHKKIFIFVCLSLCVWVRSNCVGVLGLTRLGGRCTVKTCTVISPCLRLSSVLFPACPLQDALTALL